ncbi:dihydrolipoamide acetyltransferase family protein [Nesterenkonia jeotgali]|uniref:Dihydrolipoamide acetyltransferase component of pyruvate dehydrogenase complex n=1 Tax=Nesterenkonia jeotgali TaxID=317018 RepID=A0A839FSX1_9MICC|nr:dihydrolipoamide acetyltransferase family protein [Nesterenkonia jeotgali]MBA8921681.1 pyruvate dehydrogenase E2 component (dihydrolipoamide acetyltransferase) [Nesterenkonia jeotgali]
MAETFNLPDVGEGLTEAEVVTWRTTVGATVEVNDIVVEIETAKSLVELPVPYAGVVTELLAAEGETIEVGAPLIRIAAEGEETRTDPDSGSAEPDLGSGADSGADSGVPESDEQPAAEEKPGRQRSGRAKKAAAQKREKSERGSSERTDSTPESSSAQNEALVGSGPKADSTARRVRTRSTAPDLIDLEGLEIAAPAPAGGAYTDIADIVARASPPVRALAKRLGVAVWELVGSGRNGQITRDDVERQAQQKREQRASGQTPATGAPATSHRKATPAEEGLLYEGPREENIQVRGVRKATARNVTASATTVPHVSVFKEVDVTRTMELRQVLKKDPSYEGLSVSPMLFAAKAIIWAARRNPQVNATWHDTHYTLRNYVNLGVAAATPRGLVVPVIHEAHAFNTRGLAAALTALTIDAREGRTTPGEMRGGTVSITNIGTLGLDSGTPILPPGQASIVALGAVRKKPWVVEGQIVPRDVMVIGGSFDHRLIDGDLAGRFISDVAAVMEQPGLLID